MKSKFYCALNTILHRARGASELVSVQLFKSFFVSVISYALEAVSRKCSSMSEIWFIRSMFDLEAIGVVLERRQSNFISTFCCSVLYADAVLRCI